METISILDLSKKSAGYRQYTVTFTSQKTGKIFTAYTTNSILIDKTFNSENPKLNDLQRLKKICKGL